MMKRAAASLKQSQTDFNGAKITFALIRSTDWAPNSSRKGKGTSCTVLQNKACLLSTRIQNAWFTVFGYSTNKWFFQNTIASVLFAPCLRDSRSADLRFRLYWPSLILTWVSIQNISGLYLRSFPCMSDCEIETYWDDFINGLLLFVSNDQTRSGLSQLPVSHKTILSAIFSASSGAQSKQYNWESLVNVLLNAFIGHTLWSVPESVTSAFSTIL